MHSPSLKLIGHEGARDLFENAVNSGNIHHAWMLAGTEGIGKTTLAYHISAYLLSYSTNSNSDDNGNSLFGDELPKAPSQKLFNGEYDEQVVHMIEEGMHPDLALLTPLEDKKQISVEQVREVETFIRSTPSKSEKRVVIIDSINDMNNNSSNALLKLLEEPPAHGILILVSHNIADILPTIRSRCQVIRMNPLNDDQVIQVLEQNNFDESENTKDLLLRISAGAPGKILSFSNIGDIYKKVIDIMKRNFTSITGSVDDIISSPVLRDYSDKKSLEIINQLYCYVLSVAIKTRINLIEEKVCSPDERELIGLLHQHYSDSELAELWEKANNIVNKAVKLHMDSQATLMEIFATQKA